MFNNDEEFLERVRRCQLYLKKGEFHCYFLNKSSDILDSFMFDGIRLGKIDSLGSADFSTFPPCIEEPSKIYIDGGYCQCKEDGEVLEIIDDGIEALKSMFCDEGLALLYISNEKTFIIKSWDEVKNIIKNKSIVH